MTKTPALEKLQQEIAQFARDRNWEQYHTPKNLAMALAVECAELLEIFQWLSPAESREPDGAVRTHIRQEIGDIMIYLTMIARAFDIDPVAAAREKMALNGVKHPVPKGS